MFPGLPSLNVFSINITQKSNMVCPPNVFARLIASNYLNSCVLSFLERFCKTVTILTGYFGITSLFKSAIQNSRTNDCDQKIVANSSKEIVVDANGKGCLNLSSSNLTSCALIFANRGLSQKVNSLDLHLNQLTVFESSELTNLESLNLRSNKLRKLPSGIYRYRKLQVLFLNDNYLEKLSSKITQFKELKALHLSNGLKKLSSPISLSSPIFQLVTLQTLNLSCNQIDRLPPEIGNLTALQELYFSSNQIDRLPPEIGNLTALQTLSFCNNKLKKLPPEIGNLTALQVLDVPLNKLKGLPPEIAKLTALTTLHVWGNQLKRLPLEICSLILLQKLVINDNKLKRLPAEIVQLTALTEIHLNKNKLKALLPEIGRLIRLKKLEISNNKLKRLPAEIVQLTALTAMDLRKNKLRALLPEIGRLTKLSTLWLNENRLLTALPLEIRDLSSRCVITLENCGLPQNAMQNILALVTVPGYVGPRFVFSMGGVEEEIEEKSAEDIIKALYTETKKQPNQLSGLFHDLDQNSFNSLTSWLNRLSYMKDYKSSPQTKKELIHGIVRYLELADANEAFRGEFFAIIHEAAKTCGDKMALSLIYLGIAYQSTTIKEIKPLAEFLKRGVWAIRLLEECAKVKIETLVCCDPVEVYLAYPVKLKKELNLPIPLEDMLYFNFSAVTDEDLEKAYGCVDHKINDETAFHEFLIEETRWKVALEKEFPKEYSALVTKKEKDLEDIENRDVKADYEKIGSEFKQGMINLTKRALK